MKKNQLRKTIYYVLYEIFDKINYYCKQKMFRNLKSIVSYKNFLFQNIFKKENTNSVLISKIETKNAIEQKKVNEIIFTENNYNESDVMEKL